MSGSFPTLQAPWSDLTAAVGCGATTKPRRCLFRGFDDLENGQGSPGYGCIRVWLFSRIEGRPVRSHRRRMLWCYYSRQRWNPEALHDLENVESRLP